MILPRSQARLMAEGKATLAILPIREYQPVGADFKARNRVAREVVWIRGEWRDEDSQKLQRTDVLCQVRITGHTSALLHKVTLTQAKQAGFETTGRLAQWWRERYDNVPAPASEMPWLPERKVPVRLITVTLDVPHALKRGAGFTTVGDPLNAGESVPKDYESWLATRAQEHDELRHLRKQRNEQAKMLERLYDEAEANGVDVSRQVAAIQRQMDAMDRKLKRAA